MTHKLTPKFSKLSFKISPQSDSQNDSQNELLTGGGGKQVNLDQGKGTDFNVWRFGENKLISPFLNENTR